MHHCLGAGARFAGVPLPQEAAHAKRRRRRGPPRHVREHDDEAGMMGPDGQAGSALQQGAEAILYNT
jgi:hypothetical protein